MNFKNYYSGNYAVSQNGQSGYSINHNFVESYPIDEIVKLIPPMYDRNLMKEGCVYNNGEVIPVIGVSTLNLSSLYMLLELSKLRKITNDFYCKTINMNKSVAMLHEYDSTIAKKRIINIIGLEQNDHKSSLTDLTDLSNKTRRESKIIDMLTDIKAELEGESTNGYIILSGFFNVPMSVKRYDAYTKLYNEIKPLHRELNNIIIELARGIYVCKPDSLFKVNHRSESPFVTSYDITYTKSDDPKTVISVSSNFLSVLNSIFLNTNGDEVDVLKEILMNEKALSFSPKGNIYIGSTLLLNLISEFHNITSVSTNSVINIEAAKRLPDGRITSFLSSPVIDPNEAPVFASIVPYNVFHSSAEVNNNLLHHICITGIKLGLPHTRPYTIPDYNKGTSIESFIHGNHNVKDDVPKFGYPCNGAPVFRQPENMSNGIHFEQPMNPQPGSYAKQHLFNPYDSTDMNNWAAMNPHYPSGNISTHKSLANDLSNLTSRQEFVLTLKVTTEKCCQCIKLNDNTKSIIETLHLEKDELGGYRLKMRLTGNPNDVVIYDSELSNNDILTVYEMLSVIMNYGTLNVGLPSVLANTGKCNSKMHVKNNGYGYNVEINLGK
ncbi:MAG: hypothetical protein ACRC92_27065 [Peptostreptococcaceae bacterium]